MDKRDEPEIEMEPQLRKFNPGLLQTDEEITTQFVVRQNELQTLSEVVRNNISIAIVPTRFSRRVERSR